MQLLLSVFFMVSLILGDSSALLAQGDIEKYGQVVDESGRGIPDVRIAVDGSDSYISDAKGFFNISAKIIEEMPMVVIGMKEGWETASWSISNQNQLQIVMRKSKYKLLFGNLSYSDNTPAPSHSVFLPNTDPPVMVETNEEGRFEMVLPNSVPLDRSIVFKIPEYEIVDQSFEFKGSYNYALKIAPIPEYRLPGRIFTIVVRDRSNKPISNTRVIVGNVSYMTNLNGVLKAVVVNSDDEFRVEGYNITSVLPNKKGNRVELLVDITSSLAAKRYQDSLLRAEYNRLLAEDQNRVINDTSILKQDFQNLINGLSVDGDTSLNSKDIQDDITIVAQKLEEDEAQLTRAARDTLKAYLEELDNLLLEKDLMSKENKETRDLVERLRENLLEKDEILKLLEKEKERQASEFRSKMMYFAIGITFLILVILVSIFFARKFRKQKLEINGVKQDLEVAFTDLKSHSSKITDSIRYAKTIQRAILPSESQLNSFLNDYFIIYRPKDIVSGDAYWFLETSEYTGTDSAIIAVFDCTGHGVPGGFMTMIGNTLLSEIVKENDTIEPEEILETLNERVIEALRQKEKVNDDGMDVCLCKLEKLNDEITRVSFCGAKRPLYYVKSQNQSLQYSKGNNKSIGGILYKNRRFQTENFFLQKGDVIYLTTDGMVDQHNPQNKKFGKKKFADLIQENAFKPLEEQKDILERALDDHQETQEQRDDITLMGIRV